MARESLFITDGKVVQRVGVVCFSDAIVFKHGGKKWICDYHRYLGATLRDARGREVKPVPAWFGKWWKTGQRQFPKRCGCEVVKLSVKRKRVKAKAKRRKR